MKTLWQISYQLADEYSSDGRGRGRTMSMRLYPYRTAQKLVARLRRRGNDAYIAGAVHVRLGAAS